MSKASIRRQRNRVKRFRQMLENDPVQFCEELTTRVESWQHEALIRSRSLKRKNGSAMEPVFDIVDEAGEMAEACLGALTKKMNTGAGAGHAALARAKTLIETIQGAVANECCVAVATGSGKKTMFHLAAVMPQTPDKGTDAAWA